MTQAGRELNNELKRIANDYHKLAEDLGSLRFRFKLYNLDLGYLNEVEEQSLEMYKSASALAIGTEIDLN